jgi:hypothetical protein
VKSPLPSKKGESPEDKGESKHSPPTPPVRNVHLSQPRDQHPGDIPADQILAVVMMMEVVVVV